MVSRKAVIIASPDVTPRLPGVEVDVRSIKAFLLSPTGGAWEDNEIEILMNPRKGDVQRSLALANLMDYVLITCSGHGEHHVGENFESTTMYLRENEKMYIQEMNPGNRRHLVVVDVCRKIVPVAIHESFFAAQNRMIRKAEVDRWDARRLYDNAILSCAEGRIVMYSCDKNQTAGDDGNGGYFTQELLKAPRVLLESGKIKGRVVGADDAFEYAKARTIALNAPQCPVFNAGRRRDFYPFGIV